MKLRLCDSLQGILKKTLLRGPISTDLLSCREREEVESNLLQATSQWVNRCSAVAKSLASVWWSGEHQQALTRVSCERLHERVTAFCRAAAGPTHRSHEEQFHSQFLLVSLSNSWRHTFDNRFLQHSAAFTCSDTKLQVCIFLTRIVFHFAFNG